MATVNSTNGRKAPSSNGKQGLLRRWIDTVTTHPKRLLLDFFILMAAFIGVASSIRGEFADSFSLPGAESQRAYDLLAERFPGASGSTAQIVFQIQDGSSFDDPAVQQQVDALLTDIATLPHVASIDSPYEATYQQSQLDPSIAYATVNYDLQSNELKIDDSKQLVDMVKAANTGQLRIVAGGDVPALSEFEFGNTSEIVGIIAAAIILLIAFGSVVAMGLPIVTALIGLTVGFMGIFITTRYLDIATFAPQFASMIGIGVGVDYALFIVTRFREGIHEGLSPKDATVRALDTAGRSVIFAGTVVVISMLGLSAVGIKFVAALGIAAAIVVGTAVLVAFTVLPALLTLVGTRIDKWSVRRPGSKNKAPGEPFGRKISRRIQANPWLYAIGSTVLLVVLAIPAFTINLGFPTASANPPDYQTRQAYDLLSQGFGDGFNNPLLIVFDNGNGIEASTLTTVHDAVAQVPGVVQAAEPFTNEAGDTAVMTIIPTGDANSSEVEDLVKQLRDTTLPQAVGESGTNAYVGGGTASFLDFSTKMVERTPYVFIVIIGLSFILLTIVFRSPVIALKAAIMNILSIGAAFGVIVAVFQKGWGHQLFGIEEKQPIAVFLPIFLFAILFGLSMDYEVFLLSRIREFWAHGRNTSDAVADGLAVTARVITAAAAIMICVFLSFVMNPTPVVKQMGLGLAVAVFIDATVVRLVLVPSVMELLGERNWWFPAWLDRITPHVNIEGKTDPAPGEFDPLPGAAI
jgi:RND superfamily putative drug exporter